jgi:O-antigen ligase
MRSSVFTHPLFYPICCLAAAISLSIALAKPYPFLKPLEKVGYLLALFPFTFMFQQNPEKKKWILGACLIFSFLLTIIATGQFLGLFESWGGFLTKHSKPLENSKHHFFLATGLTFHHTPFAATMTWAFHALLAHYFFSPSPRMKKWLLAGTILCVVSVLMSFSRGVWLALLFSGLLSISLFNWKKLVPLSLCGSGIFAILFFSVPEFHNRLFSIQFSENPERLKLWQIAWKMFLDKPLFGQGYHSFGYRLQEFVQPQEIYPSFPKEAHNMYLDFLATTGMVGFFSFLILIAAALIKLIQLWKSKALSKTEQPWVLATLSGFVGFLIAGFFDRHFYMSQTLVPNLVFLAIAFSLKR